MDEGYAHVQPTGAYHYHGVPDLLLQDLNFVEGEHSPLVGWAADGFPIYAEYGYADGNDTNSGTVELSSSYQLKQGARPSGEGNPGGVYDGTFVEDYEYIAGSGDLDASNGRFARTPEFPEGTYAYFLTDAFPTVPRFWSGTPSSDFLTRG